MFHSSRRNAQGWSLATLSLLRLLYSTQAQAYGAWKAPQVSYRDNIYVCMYLCTCACIIRMYLLCMCVCTKGDTCELSCQDICVCVYVSLSLCARKAPQVSYHTNMCVCVSPCTKGATGELSCYNMYIYIYNIHMCVCVCVYIYIYIYIYICARKAPQASHQYPLVYAHVCMCIYICMCVLHVCITPLYMASYHANLHVCIHEDTLT